MELRCFSAHRLLVVYICTKFHENILYGINVIKPTSTCFIELCPFEFFPMKIVSAL